MPMEVIAAKPKSYIKWWIAGFVLLGVLFAIYAGLFTYAARRLSRVVADTDRMDPKWRLLELEDSRALVPDAKNGADVVAAATALLPRGWQDWTKVLTQAERDELGDRVNDWEFLTTDMPINRRLPDRYSDFNVRMWDRLAPAIVEARKLVDYPDGRFPIKYSKDGISTLLPHVQNVREMAWLLDVDVLNRTQIGDVAGAAHDARAAVHASRTLLDEPILISQLVRLATRARAVTQLERALAHGVLDERELRDSQELASLEAESPTMLIGFRGERALGDTLMGALERGEVSIKQMRGMRSNRASVAGFGWDDLIYVARGSPLRIQHAILLERMNQAVEIAKLPTHEQAIPHKKWTEAMANQAEIVRLMTPWLQKAFEAGQRSQASWRCLTAILAVERYRLRHGAWPASLAQLTPEFLAAVPLDPFDGQPLRYRRTAEGVVIYTIGQNGKDDGGELKNDGKAPDSDLGLTLWDVDKRHLPALPIEKKAPSSSHPN